MNPDCKSIMNTHGKEILFTPDSLTLTNNAGMSYGYQFAPAFSWFSSRSIAICTRSFSTATTLAEREAPTDLKL